MLSLSLLLVFGLPTLIYADLPFLLGDTPIAVKTPYLHAWIANSLTAPEHTWATLYSLDRSIAWEGMIRVDGQTYQWLGDSLNMNNFSTTVTSGITPTRTTFIIQAGPMRFNATFFSPIEPNDYARQSVPFTYLFVDGFTAVDGMPHVIQLYSDITGEWVSHDESTQITWGTQDSSNMVYHHFQPKNPQPMVDNHNHAEDGTAYYATPKRSGLTWRTGEDLDSRNMFTQKGSLDNSSDSDFRASNDRRPTASLAIDLGSIAPNSQPDPVVWALGLVRKPLVNYPTESGLQARIGYYWSAYQGIDDVISDFLVDFPSARKRGKAFDDRILNAALQISSKYAGIASLVTRQIFASMDITIPATEGGRPNASDVKIFMKDIGMSTRANPVEVIYAALPALLYFNASFARDLLFPLLEFQSSEGYTNPYASSDLGTTYPNITGNTDAAEKLAIEHCGNMLIMTYAHAAKSGDGSLISKYHALLQKWGDYLVPNSLNTTNNAASADGFGYPKMSNLALKGIMGVYSMGKINEALNSSNTTFKDKATELFNEWKKLAVTDTHIQAQYGQPSTWGLMYNLFPAVWLQTGLIDNDILNREAQFYLSNAPRAGQSYSLDNALGNDIAYPHWALMTAAIIPSSFKSVRDTLIESTYAQANNVTQTFPLPMRYKASTGDKLIGSKASAAQGAVYAIMAMSMPNVDIRVTVAEGNGNTNAGGNYDTSKGGPVGAVVGGVIGVLALLLVIMGVILWRRRVQQARKISGANSKDYSTLRPFSTQIIPSGSEPLKYPMTNTNHRVPALVPLASKEREVLQQSELRQGHSQPVMHMPIPANSSPVSEPGGGETLRAEVDDLRREVEAMRNIAQPPPIYQ